MKKRGLALSKIIIAPIEVITDRDLSDPERRVLLILYSFKGKSGDSVFPSIDVVADMAGYTDKTRISKITKSLEVKGWLTKKRRGFTGGNSYKLIVPYTKLAADTNLDQKANSKLEPETNSKLDSETKYKEQTSEQTIEQSNNTIGVEPEKTVKPKKPDYPDWFESLWDIFPERAGGDNKKTAYQKACARLKDGASTDQLINASERYLKYIVHTGKIGTEYVKQAATFFGNLDNITNQWALPATGANYGHQAKPSLIDRFIQNNYAGPSFENDHGPLGSDDSFVRGEVVQPVRRDAGRIGPMETDIIGDFKATGGGCIG